MTSHLANAHLGFHIFSSYATLCMNGTTNPRNKVVGLSDSSPSTVIRGRGDVIRHYEREKEINRHVKAFLAETTRIHCQITLCKFFLTN